MRDRLFKEYDRHYLRVNPDNIKTEMVAHRSYESQYGKLVQSFSLGTKVLDIGCGSGYLLSWLAKKPGLVLTGVDLSDNQIQIARKKLPGTIHLECSDAKNFCHTHPEMFNVIFCLDVLEHLEKEELMGFLEVLRKALVPTGVLVCKVPNMANMLSISVRYADLTHEIGFTSLSLLHVLSCTGFVDCRIIPTRPSMIASGIRLAVNSVLHKLLYAATGQSCERQYFDSKLHATARAPPRLS